MNEYILCTSELSKKYGNIYAIQNINIKIKRGQIYGLIGENGAGKSTLMKAIAGLLTVTKGKIELFGKTGENTLLRERCKIGQIIDAPVFYPNLSAAQNIKIQMKLCGIHNEAQISNILHLVGLANVGNKKAKNYSLGMKQRLAFAIALATDPEFLILDEPVNGLDPKGIIEMRELIRHLSQDKGITILISSHLLDELSQVATNYGFIHKGCLISELSSEELHKALKRHIRIVSDNSAKAAALLKERFYITDYQIMSENELLIYEKYSQTRDMNTSMVQAGIGVDSISIIEQRLEEYYMSLTNGGK